MVVPKENDWGNWRDNLDVEYAHKLLAGKTIQDVVGLFIENPIERMDELIWVPKRIFQYYIYGFVYAIQSKEAASNSELASSFLNLLLTKEEKQKGSVSEIFKDLEPIVKYVVDNQTYFDAPVKIYGKFSDLECKLKKLCGDNIGS